MISLKHFNGRYAAIFFTVLLTNLHQVFAHEVFWKEETLISRGLLSKQYWGTRSPSADSHKVHAYLDRAIGISISQGTFQFVIENRQSSTLSSNTNVLIAASKNSKRLDNSAPGSYPLEAMVENYKYDSIGVNLSNTLLEGDFFWKIKPKLIQLNHFSIAQASGALDQSGDSQKLNGTINLQGMNSFGYTASPPPMNIHLGYGLDFQLQWKFNELDFELDATNLFSQISVDNAYYDERIYQANINSGQILFSNIPTLSGQYGQKNSVLHLPKIIKSSVGFQDPHSKWMPSLGFISVQTHNIPWSSVAYTNDNSIFTFKTYALKNLFITYTQHHFLANHLSFQLELGSALTNQTQIGSTAIIYKF